MPLQRSEAGHCAQPDDEQAAELLRAYLTIFIDGVTIQPKRQTPMVRSCEHAVLSICGGKNEV